MNAVKYFRYICSAAHLFAISAIKHVVSAFIPLNIFHV
jgi:hypothetical protein